MKGFFTQGASVLFSAPITLDELEPLLADFEIVRRMDPQPDPDIGGPSLLVAFRPEVRGYLAVDLQDRVWPDHMGDPKTEPTLFGAWSTGHFGPLAFPGNLRRAVENSWGWREAGDVVARHHAFVRLKLSYSYGAAKDDLVIPEDCDPVAELHFVTRVCRAILRHPSALATFNPNGETLKSAEAVETSLASHAERDLPPLDLWSNVRLKRGGGWLLMDTVGMGQLDRQDLEACFPEDSFQPRDVDAFLRNVSLYLLENGEVIKDLNTIDGPGGVWRAHEVEEGLCAPPRRLLRFFPEDGSTPPEALRPRRPT